MPKVDPVIPGFEPQQSDVIDFLVESGIDAFAEDHDGRTSLAIGGFEYMDDLSSLSVSSLSEVNPFFDLYKTEKSLRCPSWHLLLI